MRFAGKELKAEARGVNAWLVYVVLDTEHAILILCSSIGSRSTITHTEMIAALKCVSLCLGFEAVRS